VSETFEVFVEDSSGKISIDQLVTSLFGLTIEVVETNPIDTGIFSVLVGTSQEKDRLLNMGCLEINNFILTISGESDEIQCPICTISMKNWNESERNNHIITCTNESVVDNVVPTLDGPFSLICPYPNCGLRMEARVFPTHTFQKHSKDKQNFSCPICHLQGDTRYKVKPDTNLITHLQTSHSELIDSYLGAELQPLIPQKKSIIFPKRVHNPPAPVPAPALRQPSDYLVQILPNDTQNECPICYEFMLKGNKIARLACLCVYHQHCIESWFKQKTARKCPLHGMEN